MNIDFTGKRVLVTGGTRGIGESVAKSFLDSGADVFITGTKKDLDCKFSKSGFKYIQADFSSNESINTFIEKLEQMEKFDICINNAGINIIDNIIDSNPEDYDLLLNVNLKNVYMTCKVLSKKMVESNFGRIVNIASIWSVVSRPGRGIYSITKSGLVGLTKTLSVELAEKNVLVNAVSPGFTLTELTERTNTASEIRDIEKKIPAGRMAQPIEISNVILFLASEQNGYLTGQNIVVDGGFVNV